MTPYWNIKDRIRTAICLRFGWGGGGYCNCFSKINPALTVVSSNCTGSLICHEIGLRFNSPFVNLWIHPHDFVRLVDDLEEYMNAPLRFVKDAQVKYPVAMLKDVRIYFQHYKSEEEAEYKWLQRRARMDYEHLCIIMVQKDNWCYEDLKQFDSLPYEHKVVFTNKEYPELESAYYIRGFEDKPEIRHMYEFEGLFSLKKYYYQFDTIQFLEKV